MKKIFYEGKSKTELLNKLEQLDSMTKIDSVIQSGTYNLEFEKRHGRIKGWRILGDTDMYPASKPRSKGRKLNTFSEAISEIEEEKAFCTSNPSFNIICFAEMSPVRNWDGKVKTLWFKVNPFYPYELVNGQPKFETVELELEEDDLKMALETKIAFYEESEEVVYPIREAAMKSISRLLGLPLVFCKQAEHLLGAILVMAEVLSTKTDLRILCRDNKHNVKPVIGVLSPRYTPCPQKKFISQCLDYLYENGIYDMSEWSISDELTKVEMVKMSNSIDFQTGVLIQTSDINGIAMSVTAFAKVGNSTMQLKTNSMSHIESSHDMDISKLFEGIFKVLEDFENDFKKLLLSEVFFEPYQVASVRHVIGKKRFKKANYLPFYKKHNGAKLLKNIMEQSSMVWDAKNTLNLEKAYGSTFQILVKQAKGEQQ